MESAQSFTDYHFLNTAFSDVVDMLPAPWIEASLVRLSYRGTKDMSGKRSVSALEGLYIDYTLPFPLGYIFTSRVMAAYNDIFVFLLQIRRSKAVLEQITLRGSTATQHIDAWELKVFYAMRSKLSWFVK